MMENLTDQFHARVRAFLETTEEFYTATQPRAKDGKWTSLKGHVGDVAVEVAPPGPGKVWSGISADPAHRTKPTPKIHFPLEREHDYDLNDPVEMFGRRLYDADLGGGYTSKMVEANDHGYQPGATIRGYIYKGNREVGSFERTIIQNPDGSLTAHHDELMINASHRGQGLADRFNAHAVAEYQKIGVDNIKLTAGDTVGAFAWARQGFRFDEAEGPGARQEFLHGKLDHIEKMVKLLPLVRQDAPLYTKQIGALRKAIDAGEDVQPIHIASIGEKTKWESTDEKGNYYKTWMGKQSLLHTSWKGVYYFDAAQPIAASASSLEHAALRPKRDPLADLTETFYNQNHSHQDGRFTSRGTAGPNRAARPGYGPTALPDVSLAGVKVTYKPKHPDGHPDPGEIVWAKIPFQDDPTQSKDRPCLVIGRVNGSDKLAAIQLTSQIRGRDFELPVGSGSWDRSGRPSAAKLDRIVQIDPTNYRREGSVMPEAQFQNVIGRLAAHHRTPVAEFEFNPHQPRDHDGKWTVGIQHVASKSNAESIIRNGFSLDTPAWDRSFGDGVYLAESGDAKSAKFYARQGDREWRSAHIIEGTVSLSNPLHIEAREHSNFRAQVIKALGGTEAVQAMAQERYDHTVAVTKRIVAEEVGADHGIPLDHPEKVNWYHVDGAEKFPDLIWVSKDVEAASDRIHQRVKEETGRSITENGSWWWLAHDIDKIAKPGVGTSSDNYSNYSALIGNLARDAGYDGIVINTKRWGGFGGTQIVVFNPDTIKVTGSRPYHTPIQIAASAWFEEFYSPSEPRDRNGRWTFGRSRLPNGADTKARFEELHDKYLMANPEATQNNALNRAEARELREFRDLIPEDLTDAVRVRVPIGALDNVLAEGLVTQHQTETSKGLLSTGMREQTEHKMFGVNAAQPVYGYIHNEESRIDIGAERLDGYSPAAIVLKDVEDRTTVTFGDSLYKAPAAILLTEARTADVDHIRAARGYGDDVVSDNLGYVEAQIHGSITPSDIAKIVISGDIYFLDREEVHAIAAKYGVPVEDSTKRTKSKWGGTYSEFSIEEFYAPTQPRDKEGQWTRHRSGITSLSQQTLDNAINKGVDGIFSGHVTGDTPWPTAPRRKGERIFSQDVVDRALKRPPVLEAVDPRILYSTQPGLVKTHVEYYRTGEYERTGRTAADHDRPLNEFPVVYVNGRNQHIILTGHHRAAAALVDGRDLRAIVIREDDPTLAMAASAFFTCDHGNLTAACHDASCRPPTSGGTGGSKPSAGRGSAPKADPVRTKFRETEFTREIRGMIANEPALIPLSKADSDRNVSVQQQLLGEEIARRQQSIHGSRVTIGVKNHNLSTLESMTEEEVSAYQKSRAIGVEINQLRNGQITRLHNLQDGRIEPTTEAEHYLVDTLKAAHGMDPYTDIRIDQPGFSMVIKGQKREKIDPARASRIDPQDKEIEAAVTRVGKRIEEEVESRVMSRVDEPGIRAKHEAAMSEIVKIMDDFYEGTVHVERSNIDVWPYGDGKQMISLSRPYVGTGLHKGEKYLHETEEGHRIYDLTRRTIERGTDAYLAIKKIVDDNGILYSDPNKNMLAVYELTHKMVMSEVMSEIRPMGGKFAKEPVSRKTIYGGLNTHEQVKRASAAYPSSWIELSNNRNPLDFKSTKTRAHYVDNTLDVYNPNSSRITLNGTVGTAVHEMAHRMEQTVPGVLHLERTFWDRRTEHDEMRKLSDVTGIKGYASHEITKSDDFFDAYAGKSYGGRAFELLSMGYEHLQSAAGWRKVDPDYRAWTLGVLATAYHE